ncbi:MAG: AraC family transcriptional regulator [Pseudomonadota bacterium]
MGQRFTTPKLTVDLNTAEPFQANFLCPELIFSLQLGRRDYEIALGSDRMVQRSLVPGSITVSPTGSTILARTGDVNTEFLAFSFRQEMVTQALDDCQASPGDIRILPDLQHPESVSLGRALRTFLMNAGGRNELYGETLSLAILLNVIATLRKPSSRRANGFGREQICMVCDYIDANLDGQLALSDLSALLDVSVYHFSRGFRKAIGMSAHQYVLERRLTRARELLSGDQPLAEVAYAVGFSSQAHMTDVFRKHIGVTPGRYRREAAM